MHRRCVGSSGVEDPASKSPLLASTRPSDRPTLHLDQGVGSSGAECFVLARLCMNSNWASDRPTVSPLRPSDHPVLNASSWRVSVWIQTERRIGRRCPHSDRRIIRCYCLRCSPSATRLTLLKIGPSVHPTVPRVSPCVLTRPTIAPTLAKLIPSVHPTVSFLFLFFAWFWPFILAFLTCGFLVSLGPRSVYKDMLKQCG
jgi:hypothetical protein